MIKRLNNYTEGINEQLKYEAENGSNIDDFLALVNMSKELAPLANYSSREIKNVWKNYRINNLEQNHMRHEPSSFEGFQEVIGLENIKNCFEQGGIFATFHFGHYRHVPFELIKTLNMDKDNSIDIVVDRESYNSESELTKWIEIREKYNINYIISEEQTSGLKLLRLIKKGGSIFLYLDGNSGSGDDSTPLEVQHITSQTKVRSGIFRLAQLTKKPLCIVIADLNANGEPRLIGYQPILITKENFEESVENAYSLFRDTLIEQPYLWRFWYRHHLHASKWLEVEKSNSTEPFIDWRSNNNLGVDLATGSVFRV